MSQVTRARKKLFSREFDEYRGFRGGLVRAARITYLAGRGFRSDFCLERAMSLAFASLISLFPLTVLFVTIASSLGQAVDQKEARQASDGGTSRDAIVSPAESAVGLGTPGEDPASSPAAEEQPGENTAADDLASDVSPDESEEQPGEASQVSRRRNDNIILSFVHDKLLNAIAPEFKEPLQQWFAQTEAFNSWPTGIVNLFAIAVLFFSALGILTTSERIFNRIWKAPARRSFLQKATVFWVILTTSPFLIIASIWVGDFLLPPGGAIDALTQKSEVIRFFYNLLLPIFVVSCGFTLLYLFLPSTRVKPASAAIAGLCAAILWEISKRGFSLYIHWAGRETNFFSHVFTIPLFLLWMYLTWAIILAGCELGYAHQHLAMLSRGARKDGQRRRYSFAFCGVYILSRVAAVFRAGRPVLSLAVVSEELLEDEEAELSEVARHLVDRGYLVEDSESPSCYTLGRHPQSICLRQVFEELEVLEFPGEKERRGMAGAGAAGEAGAVGAAGAAGPPIARHVNELFRAAFQNRADQLGDLSLEELVNRLSEVELRAEPAVGTVAARPSVSADS